MATNPLQKRLWSRQWAAKLGNAAIEEITRGNDEFAGMFAQMAAAHAFCGHPELMTSEQYTVHSTEYKQQLTLEELDGLKARP